MSYDFLVACDLLVADRTAVEANGWRRVRQNVWEKPDGKLVKYVTREEEVAGCARGTILYLGAGWAQNEKAVGIVDVAYARQLKVIPIRLEPLKGERDKK